MRQLLISRAEFADYVGVSRAAVTKACGVGGLLAGATYGKRVDAAHPAAVAYCTNKNKAPYRSDMDDEPAAPAPVPHVRGKAAAAATRKASTTGNDTPAGIPPNIADFLDMPLRVIVGKFGTDVRFLDWLKAAKVIEEISGKRYQNAETRGELVPREFVSTHMIGALEELSIRLLNDAPPTIASAAIEGVKGGRTKEDIEQDVQKIIARQIQTAKAKITKALRNA